MAIPLQPEVEQGIQVWNQIQPILFVPHTEVEYNYLYLPTPRKFLGGMSSGVERRRTSGSLSRRVGGKGWLEMFTWQRLIVLLLGVMLLSGCSAGTSVPGDLHQQTWQLLWQAADGVDSTPQDAFAHHAVVADPQGKLSAPYAVIWIAQGLSTASAIVLLDAHQHTIAIITLQFTPKSNLWSLSTITFLSSGAGGARLDASTRAQVALPDDRYARLFANGPGYNDELWRSQNSTFFLMQVMQSSILPNSATAIVLPSGMKGWTVQASGFTIVLVTTTGHTLVFCGTTSPGSVDSLADQAFQNAFEILGVP